MNLTYAQVLSIKISYCNTQLTSPETDLVQVPVSKWGENVTYLVYTLEGQES